MITIKQLSLGDKGLQIKLNQIDYIIKIFKNGNVDFTLKWLLLDTKCLWINARYIKEMQEINIPKHKGFNQVWWSECRIIVTLNSTWWDQQKSSIKWEWNKKIKSCWGNLL